MKNSLGKLLRNEEAWEHYKLAESSLGALSPEAPIPALEKALALDPTNLLYKDTLLASYVSAGTERVMGPLDSVCSDLRSPDVSEGKSRQILSHVRKIKEFPLGNMAPEYSESYSGLDEAFRGALRRFDQALSLEPDYPDGYAGRARAYQHIADHMLLYTYGIWPSPKKRSEYPPDEPEGEAVRYRAVRFGVCFREQIPDLEFGDEILWLYEQAEKNYGTALWLDPTDTKSYVELSRVLGQLGKGKEADDNLSKALFILNRAILADSKDERSYSQRAEILEEMGRINLAIADLEHMLTLATRDYQLRSLRDKIDKLNKSLRRL